MEIPAPPPTATCSRAEDGHVLAAHGETIGRATNNVAEYSGLVAGLQKAAELGVRELDVVSDSELLVKQMQGEYRVKNEALKELWEEASDLERRFGRVRYTAVRRAHNELADQARERGARRRKLRSPRFSDASRGSAGGAAGRKTEAILATVRGCSSVG